jgi:hypothetical protein
MVAVDRADRSLSILGLIARSAQRPPPMIQQCRSSSESGGSRALRRPVTASALANEATLEAIPEADPSILGLDVLLVIGRQVITSFGKRIDLLCIDGEGTLYVIEVKKARTPREVVAQALDYGFWIDQVSIDEIADLYAKHHEGESFADGFRHRFDADPPDELPGEHQLVIVASSLDPSTDRIVRTSEDAACLSTLSSSSTSVMANTSSSPGPGTPILSEQRPRPGRPHRRRHAHHGTDIWWGSVFLLGVPVMALLLVLRPSLLPSTGIPVPGGWICSAPPCRLSRCSPSSTASSSSPRTASNGRRSCHRRGARCRPRVRAAADEARRPADRPAALPRACSAPRSRCTRSGS